jgi:hypothetical protein
MLQQESFYPPRFEYFNLNNESGIISASQISNEQMCKKFMNRKDRKIFYFLTTSQGIFYIILGISVALFSLFNPSLTSRFTQVYNTGVVAGLLIGVGCSLYKSRGFQEPRNSIYYLGLICSVTCLINQINHSGDAPIFQFVDVVIQTMFVLLWSYLLYWRWVIGEFLKLSSKNRKRKHKNPVEGHHTKM